MKLACQLAGQRLALVAMLGILPVNLLLPARAHGDSTSSGADEVATMDFYLSGTLTAAVHKEGYGDGHFWDITVSGATVCIHSKTLYDPVDADRWSHLYFKYPGGQYKILPYQLQTGLFTEVYVNEDAAVCGGTLGYLVKQYS